MNNIENIQEYIPTVYVNDSEPDLDETNLNKTEQAIKRVTDAANKAIDALKQLDREKLALSAISNVLSDATDKVPSLALANTMQLAINDLNSNLELSSITTITDIEDSGITGQIYYRIKAGVCYINCRVTTTASATPRDGAILCRGLPEAAVGQTQYCSNGQGTINIGVIYIDNNSGVLKSNLSGKAGNGYTSFSYPIKQ